MSRLSAVRSAPLFWLVLGKVWGDKGKHWERPSFSGWPSSRPGLWWSPMTGLYWSAERCRCGQQPNQWPRRRPTRSSCRSSPSCCPEVRRGSRWSFQRLIRQMSRCDTFANQLPSWLLDELPHVWQRGPWQPSKNPLISTSGSKSTWCWWNVPLFSGFGDSSFLFGEHWSFPV
jgi:hypothetical protein